ncbi:MAG: peptidase U32 family protein [Dorea longicatena]
MNRDVEILAPAGSMECLRAAVAAGADAIYLGGTKFGARAYAQNLSEEDLVQAIEYVHIHGRKIYMTVNTLLKDRELNELYAYLLPYYKAGLDGVIVQDIGAVKFIGEYFPEMPVHASTQMTITNTLGADFLKRYGITRVVPARELSLKEIRDMKKQTGLEMECFVHGALCYCYSGQCLLSSMIGGRSGNRGQCAQPCRLPYQTEGKKPADLMSLKDLCTIDILPELIDAGIDSFKIEGRMKQPEYVYTVVKMYRKYADQYLKLQKEGKGKSSYHVSEADKRELLATYQRRGYCEGYYYQHNGKDMVSLKRPKNGRDGSAEEKPWQNIKVQEKINGILTLSVGNRAKLKVSCGDVTVECIGQEVQAAQKQPLDPARIEKQMRKTGNTEFTFDNLEILIEGNVFLPMQALNELRREGIEELTEQIQMQYRREEAGCGMKTATAGFDSDADGVTETAGKKECCISASVQNKAQLDTAVNSKIRYIYLEEDVEFEREDGVQYFLAMPYIFRENTIKRYEKMYTEIEKKYDGILIRNWESYAWLKRHEYQKEIRSDYNLYIFNRKTKEELRRLGIARGTASVELNDRELARIGIEEQVFIAYGYQPVMISAGCIQKTSASCDGKGGVLSISDRYQKKFAVRRYCRDCYNVMYNSAPLFLADKAEEVHALAPAELRLDFTTESSGQVKEICHAYTLAFEKGCKTEPPMQDYTRGHFKRGVK